MADLEVKLPGCLPPQNHGERKTVKICSFEISFDQSSVRKVRTAEVRTNEFRLAEVRPVEVRLAEVRLAEIEVCLRVLPPPLIPDFDSLFKHREMFGIRRGASKSVGAAVFNDTLALDCPAIIRRT